MKLQSKKIDSTSPMPPDFSKVVYIRRPDGTIFRQPPINLKII